MINPIRAGLMKHHCNHSNEATITTQHAGNGKTKTIIDAGSGNDKINIHTNHSGSVTVTINGKHYYFTAKQAQNLEVKGGSGNDQITFSGGTTGMWGGTPASPNITIDGGRGNDTIAAVGENNLYVGAWVPQKPNITINGGSGNDLIFGGKGEQTINGGSGNDIILGGRGNDTIKGGRGNDIILGGAGEDTIKGGRGNDTVLGGAGDDTIKGGKGNDVIFGGRGDDTIKGGRGNDTIFGGRGDDIIKGGRGNDAIFGGPGNDSIHCDPVAKPKTSFNQSKGTATWENVNYRISALESSSQLLVENKNTGESYRIWGDPHVDVDGKRGFDFKKDAVFRLDDGTEIHIKTVEYGKNTKTTLSSDITIVDGQSDSAVQWNNLDQNTKGDMSQVITTKDAVHCDDLVNSDTGLIFDEADGAENKGFEILNKNDVFQSLTGNAGDNTALVTQTENALNH